MVKNPAIFQNEESTAFHLAVSQAITQWSHVEYGLFLIALQCFGPKPTPALNAFYAIENFRSKLSFVDRAFEAAKFKPEHRPEWVKLREHASSLSTIRNKVAHWRLVVYPGSRPGRQFALIPNFPIPGKKQPASHLPPAGSLCLIDLDLAGRQFGMAWMLLADFAGKIGGGKRRLAGHAQPEPLPQTLAQIRHQMYARLPTRGRASRG